MPGPFAPSDSRNYLGIGKQTVLGTGVAPTVWVPYHDDVDLDHGVEVDQIKEAGGAGVVTDAEKISQMGTIKSKATCRPSITARLFAYLLGADVVTGLGPYTHTITSDFVTDYLSIEHNLADDAIERFIDSAVVEMGITCDVEKPKLRFEVSIALGKAGWQGAATAESYETDVPFLIGDGAFTIDSAVVTNVRKFSYSSKMILSRERVTQVWHEYAVKTGEEAEVEIEQFEPANLNDYRKVSYGTTTGTAPLATATAGAFIADFNYGAGAAARELKLEIPTLDYSEAKYTSMNPDADEAVKVTRMGIARYDRTNPIQRITAKTNDSAAYV